MADVGRPSSYKPEYAEQAYKFCLLGATDEKLADSFDVCVATIHNWKLDYPEFLDALKRGKEIADAEVASALFHRAKGYSHPDVDIKMYEGCIIETPLIKHYPPDTGAAMSWLKNRQPTIWRDRKELDLSSSDGSMSPKSPAEMNDAELLAHIKQLESK